MKKIVQSQGSRDCKKCPPLMPFYFVSLTAVSQQINPTCLLTEHDTYSKNTQRKKKSRKNCEYVYCTNFTNVKIK